MHSSYKPRMWRVLRIYPLQNAGSTCSCRLGSRSELGLGEPRVSGSPSHTSSDLALSYKRKAKVHYAAAACCWTRGCRPSAHTLAPAPRTDPGPTTLARFVSYAGFRTQRLSQ